MYSSIRYQYALIDGSEDIIDIESLKDCERNSHSFLCPHCKSTLIPVLGNKRIHHFRHKEEICDPDKYLHTLAEKVFVEEFNRCVETNTPFIIEYKRPITCMLDCLYKNTCSHCDTVSIDLAKDYVTASSECRVDFDEHYRRPDILLGANDGRRLWIEIWVTHETGTEKMKEASIIEVKINSEDDISMIRNHHLNAIKTSNLDIAFLSEPEMIFKFNTAQCIDFKSAPNPLIRKEEVQFKDARLWDAELKQSQLPEYKDARLWDAEPKQSQLPESFPVLPVQPRKVDKIPPRKPKIINDIPVFEETQVDWVDLGLPSGTLWAREIEPYMVIFSNAVKAYNTYLPSNLEAEELRRHCIQIYDYETRSVILIGPNGNSISIACPKKDSITLWLNRYDNDGVSFFTCDFNKYGRCMNITASQFFINNADSFHIACVLLTRKP